MKLSVNLKDKIFYNIIIKNNYNSFMFEHLNSSNKGQKWILCYPKNLKKQSQKLYNNFKSLKYDIHQIEIDDGEAVKDFNNIKPIINELHSIGCRRDSTLIAFGGGTVGDYIGFVASIYMRGIEYVNIPTTLLSMVDSCVGGKTGLNLNSVKNVIGTFHHPTHVIVDPLFLNSLSRKHMLSGIGEIVKYGFIQDPSIINLLIENFDNIVNCNDIETINMLIYKCLSIKCEIVQKDEKDTSMRQILNFGHTFGHILESKYYKKGISHGEAVLHGIYLAIKLSFYKSSINNTVFEKLNNILESVNFRNSYHLNKSDIDQIKFDKKNTFDRFKFILLKDIGNPIISDNISKDDILQII